MDPIRVGKYTFSPELFERGFAGGQSPCTCTSACCSGGVYADVTERDAILAHSTMIARYMDDTQVRDPEQWFEQTASDDPDFASGRCVGTEVVNEKCAFLDRSGRCSIQVASTAEGMHKWALKPLYCILYPIEISDHTVGFDDMLQDEHQCCTVQAPFDVPLFEGCREELIHLLGEEGFARLRSAYQARSVPSPSTEGR